MNGEIDFLWNVYNAIKDWIKFSETKAGAILAFYAVIGSVILPKTLEFRLIIINNIYILIIFSLCLAFSIGSITLCFLVIFPKVKMENEKSLIFYHDIAESCQSATKYTHEMKKILNDEDVAFKQISIQIWALSKIAQSKYYKIYFAIICFLISAITAIIFYLLILQFDP